MHHHHHISSYSHHHPSSAAASIISSSPSELSLYWTKFFLPDGLASVRPSARQSMSIASVQVFLGWPRPWTPIRLSFWTLFNQPAPGHLSQRVRTAFARSSTCILSKIPCQLTWSLVVMPHIHRIIVWSLYTLQAMQVRWGWGPDFPCMEHGTPDTWTVNYGGDGKWAGVEDRQELVEFAPCNRASCDSSKFTTATWI